MSSSPSEPKWRQPGLGGVRPARVGAGVLLLLAIVIPLLVPTYARRDPELWGFPFLLVPARLGLPRGRSGGFCVRARSSRRA